MGSPGEEGSDEKALALRGLYGYCAPGTHGLWWGIQAGYNGSFQRQLGFVKHTQLLRQFRLFGQHRSGPGIGTQEEHVGFCDDR